MKTRDGAADEKRDGAGFVERRRAARAAWDCAGRRHGDKDAAQGAADSRASGVVPFLTVPGSLSSKTGTGWTWGGGTEVAIDAHWSAKLESLYVNSGSSIHGTFPPTAAFPAEFKERFVIIRFGLNYAFN